MDISSLNYYNIKFCQFSNSYK